ncbi:MAG TPA: sulfotransferase domain-containing protein [Rhabdochlamydiaceae bacterium]|jgi:hypothetical protein
MKNQRASQSKFYFLLLSLVFFFSSPMLMAMEWQRAYLATFPRSGNHWMRYLIEEATHIATSSVYCDPDKPHLDKLFPWKGYCADHGYEGRCRYPEPEEVVVVKTHYPHLQPFEGDLLPFTKAIHIVRHPVDCLYSLYLHSQNGKPSTPVMPKQTLMGFIHSMKNFEEYWTQKENVMTIRYEDLFDRPFPILKAVLQFIGYEASDEDILRAVRKHPPSGEKLKHWRKYPLEDLKYIQSELQAFMYKYNYTMRM